LVLAKQVLINRLGQVLDSDFMWTVHDGQGCVIWTGGNPAVCAEADRNGFRPGALWGQMGTNAARLVSELLAPAAQIYSAEHWFEFQTRWTCTAAGVFEPRTGRLIAVINVTGAWMNVHRDTLGRLVEIARRIEDALPTTLSRRQWGRLAEAAGPLQRIGGPALVIDCAGVVVDAHELAVQPGDQLALPQAGIVPGWTFLPALGWASLEPLPARGWLIRPLRDGQGTPVIRVTLDLADPH
jgi:transcriptional regulator of acetoin/glycerol metabolism